MHTTIEPLLAYVRDPGSAIRSLSAPWLSGADRLAQLNLYAGLAALDNASHHFLNLARSKDLGDAMELHMQSLIPAAESAKAYIGQVLACSAASLRAFEHAMQARTAGVPN